MLFNVLNEKVSFVFEEEIIYKNNAYCTYFHNDVFYVKWFFLIVRLKIKLSSITIIIHW